MELLVMSGLGYRLNLTISTPKVVTEGEEFEIIYKIKNTGTNLFPGGRVVVEITWSSLSEKVYQSIDINEPLSPGEETEPTEYSQAPLSSGYTWFYVANATASDRRAVQVYKDGGVQLWPLQQVQLGDSTAHLRRPLHAVRARTHEEITEHRALWVAAGALVLLVLFEIIDWLFRYLKILN